MVNGRLDYAAACRFSSTEVSRILHIPRRKVLFFVEQGIIQVRAPGKGSSRAFRLQDLHHTYLLHQLSLMGMAPRYLAMISVELRGALDDYIKRRSPNGERGGVLRDDVVGIYWCPDCEGAFHVGHQSSTGAIETSKHSKVRVQTWISLDLQANHAIVEALISQALC